MGTTLLASLFDPLTYTPIPFVKGLGFTKAFTRGGAISAGSVGATEIVRHNYDPLATNEQTIAYVSSAGLFGGIFLVYLLYTEQVLKQNKKDYLNSKQNLREKH